MTFHFRNCTSPLLNTVRSSGMNIYVQFREITNNPCMYSIAAPTRAKPETGNTRNTRSSNKFLLITELHFYSSANSEIEVAGNTINARIIPKTRYTNVLCHSSRKNSQINRLPYDNVSSAEYISNLLLSLDQFQTTPHRSWLTNESRSKGWTISIDLISVKL